MDSFNLVREFQDDCDWDDSLMIQQLCSFIDDTGQGKALARLLSELQVEVKEENDIERIFDSES